MDSIAFGCFFEVIILHVRRLASKILKITQAHTKEAAAKTWRKNNLEAMEMPVDDDDTSDGGEVGKEEEFVQRLKRKSKEERTIRVFEKEKIQLLRGPYGPYIKKGLRNFPIPKERHETVGELTLEDVQKMIEEAMANPVKRRPPPRKKAS
jgi:hypothetical protein